MKTLQLLTLIIISSVLSSLALHNEARAQVTELSASVDRNTVLLDESITLSVIARGDANRDDIDFTALQNDFSISRPSFSQSTQIINGNMTRSISWTVNLYPKATGVFTIPSFDINGERSNSFAVTVLALTAQNQNEPRDYFVETSLSSESVYLQQQLLYTIKIHLSQDIQRGNLSLPSLEGAIIEQIGEDKDYQEISNGVRYRIIERNYAIIPQSSGEFTIEGPIFEAQVLSSSRQSFANFGRTRTISRRGPDVSLRVMPMPENYPYTWLPSELLEVQEEWQGDENALVVGEPITRTITLTAMGLTKEQLPSISTPYHPSFKTYPEQAELSSVEHRNAIVSQGVYNTAIIPSQAGDYVLPEIKVPWFNVNTGQTEFALLPAKTVSVAAKPMSGNTNTAANTTSNSIEIEDTSKPSSSPVMTASEIQNPNWIVYALIASNVFTLILAMVLWLSKSKQKEPTKETSLLTSKSKQTEADYFNLLIKKLEQGNCEHLSENLDCWLKALLGTRHHSVSLSLSKAKQNGATSSVLSQYNKALASQYTDTSVSLDYPLLIKGLKDYRQDIMQQAQKPLEELYPRK